MDKEKIGKLLKRERTTRCWSQAKLAEKLGGGCAQEMVSRWESGRKTPDKYYQEKLCELFGKTAIEFGFIEPEEPSKGVVPSRFSAQIAHTTQFPGMSNSSAVNPSDELSLPLWERLSRTLEKSSHVDIATINGLEEIIKRCWQLRINIGYSSLLRSFLGHLETLTLLLQGSNTPNTRKPLCAISSKIAQYIGAIYFDMNNYILAQSYYSVAINASEDAEDDILQSIGLGRNSSPSIYSNRSKDALPLLQKAQQLALSHSDTIIGAWLIALEAEVYANLHDETNCLHSLSRCSRLIEQSENRKNADEIQFDHSRFMGYKGTCHVLLRQSNEAISTFRQDANPKALSPRQQSIILADLAMAYVQRTEIEKACHIIQFSNQLREKRFR